MNLIPFVVDDPSLCGGPLIRGPRLQIFEATFITDPAELAAIDVRQKLAEKAMAQAGRNSGKRKSPTKSRRQTVREIFGQGEMLSAHP